MIRIASYLLFRARSAALAALCALVSTAPAGAQPAAPSGAPAAGAALGCVIEPAQTAEVAASASGVLAAVLVDRGTMVRRGQVLAVLESDVEQAALEAARARAGSYAEVHGLEAARDLAKTKLRRMHALSQLDYGGRLELETAAAEFEIADHKLQQAREALAVARRDEDLSRRQLEQRRILSPIDGIVADRMLNPGERVDGRPILKLVSVDRLRVEVVVPASRFGEIRPGMRASVQPDGVSAPEVGARVTQVDRFVDAASGTFRARLTLANGDGRMPAGVRCKVAFGDEPAAPSARPASVQPSPRKPAADRTASSATVRPGAGAASAPVVPLEAPPPRRLRPTAAVADGRV